MEYDLYLEYEWKIKLDKKTPNINNENKTNNFNDKTKLDNVKDKKDDDIINEFISGNKKDIWLRKIKRPNDDNEYEKISNKNKIKIKNPYYKKKKN